MRGRRLLARVRIGAVLLLAVGGAGCSGTDDASGGTRGTTGDEPRTSGSVAESGFGLCEDVTLEEYQQIFGDRFTAVKVGGTAADCTIVARDTYIGESLTIRDTAKAGYGESYAAARTAAQGDRLCPASAHDVDGIGDRAFYVATCDPKERPNESLHVELGGAHMSYSAFFIPADRIPGAEEALIGIARRQLR